MRKLFRFETQRGPFFIAGERDRFHVVFEDESLGSYATPQQAAEDVAGGHTFSPPGGFDTATLGIPYDVSEWERLPSAT